MDKRLNNLELNNFYSENILYTEDDIKNIARKIPEINSDQVYLNTNQISTNHQKLLDFISDKNKLNLKSHFDHKGSDDFLSGKNEALEKIELDINISQTQNEENCKINESEEINKLISKNKHKNKSPIIQKKKKRKLSQEEFKKSNFELEKKPSKIRKKNYKSNKQMNKHRLTETKEKNKFGEDFIFTNVFLGIKAETGSIIPKSKKREDKKKKNIINVKVIKDTKISINSISTVDSKLFNNKKEYEKYKNFIDKDDSLLDLISQLKSDNKLNQA